MASTRFNVLASDAVLTRFRAEIDRVRKAGKLPEVEPLLRKIFSGLALIPEEMGEGRAPLPGLRLQQRVVFLAPVVVHYAVNLEEHVVWIQSVQIRFSP
jgi:hypothetical protein